MDEEHGIPQRGEISGNDLEQRSENNQHPMAIEELELIYYQTNQGACSSSYISWKIK